MKILWLVHVKMPEIYQIQGLENQTYVGGWLSGLIREITADEELSRIMICYPAQKEESGESGKITFHSFRPDDSGLLQRFQALLCDFAPDVIHIHGTEFPFSNTMAAAAEKNQMIQRVVCSIQGLVSVYTEHFYAGIPKRVIEMKLLITGARGQLGTDLVKELRRRGLLQNLDESEEINACSIGQAGTEPA